MNVIVFICLLHLSIVFRARVAWSNPPPPYSPRRHPGHPPASRRTPPTRTQRRRLNVVRATQRQSRVHDNYNIASIRHSHERPAAVAGDPSSDGETREVSGTNLHFWGCTSNDGTGSSRQPRNTFYYRYPRAVTMDPKLVFLAFVCFFLSHSVSTVRRARDHPLTGCCEIRSCTEIAWFSVNNLRAASFGL